jgi:hypothetical protein
LVRHAELHTRCVEAAFRSGVNILRHSEHRLRFGIERTLDKPASMAEFSASLAKNQVTNATNNHDALHQTVEKVDQ